MYIHYKHSVNDRFFTLGERFVGIAKSNHQKIFDKFFMSHRNRTSTGLGLFLVREAVRELHGSIEVSSEPGRVVYPRLIGEYLKITIRRPRTG